MKIKVLYEDANILAIDKPSGIMVHADGKSTEKTIADWFVKNYPKSKNVGEKQGDILRPGIVHRLDKETSGVLLLAKTEKAHEWLKKQFKDHEIKKTYLTVVDGFVKKDHDVINKPIGRSPSDFRRRLAGRGARGELREAITEYKVLKKIEIKKEKYSILEVSPKTGRTHQIRVHMKYASHPVVCDKLYAPKNICPKEFGRMMLHAKKIEFKNLKGKLICIESPLPVEFDI